jgi:hypothetical protein
MVAGGAALGGGRYSEEAAERDAREALIAEEREQLRSAPEQEFVELMGLYEAKGLSPKLARQVAAELTAIDALTAHVEAEHRLPVRATREAPVIVGGAAGLAYALGALVPLLAVMLTPRLNPPPGDRDSRRGRPDRHLRVDVARRSHAYQPDPSPHPDRGPDGHRAEPACRVGDAAVTALAPSRETG